MTLKLRRSTLSAASSLATCALLLLILLTAGGCATQEVIYDRAVMHIYNGTAKQLTLKFKDCDDETNVYRDVAVLNPKTRATVEIDAPCVDGQAVDRRGDIMGTQSRLRAPPEITWDIY